MTGLKRRNKRWPGLKEAAEKLGVDYNHVRLVLTGKRESRRLLDGLRALDYQFPKATKAKILKAVAMKKPDQKPAMPMPPEFAAMENLSPFFFGTLQKLGLEILVVRLDCPAGSPVWNHDNLAQDLSQALQAVDAGQFDASAWVLGAQYHFFHVGKLALAVATLKDALAARDLLPYTSILHAETAHELRVWFDGSDKTALAALVSAAPEA